MKNLFIHLKDYRREAVCGPLFKLLEASFELLVPLVVATIIDTGIGQADRGYILRCGLILAGLALVGLLCSATAQFFCAKAAVGFGVKLRQALFEHIIALSPAAYDRIGTPTLITRLTVDVNQVQTGVNMVLRLFLRSPFIVFGAVVMAFVVDAPMATVFVGMTLILAIIVGAILLIGIPLFERIQGLLDTVVKQARENLTGVRVLRAFCREGAEQADFDEKSGRLAKLQIATARITGLMNPLTLVVVNLCIIILLYQGAGRVSAGVLTQGAVVALVNYMAQILIELIKLANLLITVTRSFASGKRLAAVFEVEEGKDNEPVVGVRGVLDVLNMSSVQGRLTDRVGLLDAPAMPYITFQNVSLRYPGAAENALTDINFTVNKGETVGIIGGTGAGKTSLVHLLTRFYDLTGGSVRVASQDLREIAPADVRADIGIAMQRAAIFAGTVRDNLRWSKADAAEAEMWEALRIAQADGFVRELPGQLDAPVGQEGRNFSGGQRQRLSLARALIRQPAILILDDSTSDLDFLTESALIKELQSLPWQPTTFIISQREAAVSHAQRVITLEQGSIISDGATSRTSSLRAERSNPVMEQ
jgi:ABC-type multidrug transport system fused ATPase/permease subunit